MKIVTLLMITGLFACGETPSATTSTVPAPVDAVTTYLTLTDSQLTGFTAIRQTEQTAAQPIQTQLRSKQEELRSALKATPVNTATVTSLQTEIAALKAQLDKIEADARTQMAALLTSAQKVKLATLEAAAALKEEIQGAEMVGLLSGGPGLLGPGGGRKR